MDFQNLGKHCFESTCRQKDFLPFECKFCKKDFCLDHRETSAHACPKANTGDMKAISCPICLKTLVYDASQSNENEFVCNNTFYWDQDMAYSNFTILIVGNTS